MASKPFKVGNHVRDITEIKGLDGKPIQGRINRIDFEGRLYIAGRDGREYFYGGPNVLYPLSNLERIKATLRIS